MLDLETFTFRDDGKFPNSPLPLLLYRGAVEPDASAIEQIFQRNGWANSWRDGIYRFHHFHSIAHEVLGIAAGEVSVTFGGPSGEVLTVRAGDVVVIPAGVAHYNDGQSPDLLVIGAYPGGAEYDIKRGDPAEYEAVRRAIAAVPVPERDPITGQAMTLWATEASRPSSS